MKINNCPSLLIGGFGTYSPKASAKLFSGSGVSHILGFNIEEFQNTEEVTQALNRISVSGVQEKFPAIVRDGEIRIAKSEERSTHILKPAPWDNTLIERKQIPANEHLTMQVASQVYGIETAVNGLCFTPKGQSVYITRRFDIMSDGRKLLMEDFGSILGKSEKRGGAQYKYTGSYDEIADALRRKTVAWMVETEKFFNRVVFNYIYANGDAHLKNFSLILRDEEYLLAPAYDLLNTELHVTGADFGLDGGLSPDLEKSYIYERTGHPCRLDFERFGLRIGLKKGRIDRLLNRYSSLPKDVEGLVSRSYLSEKMKRNYLRIVRERTARFNRVSE